MKSYQDYLDKLWENVEAKSREVIVWETRLETYKEDHKVKLQTLNDIEQLLPVKSDSLNTLELISRFYEKTSCRKEIEDIIANILSNIHSVESMEYKFIKKYMKSQHEVYIKRVQKDELGFKYLLPVDNTGGGNRDIIDIIIRILVLKQHRESVRVLVIDEPMKNLSRDLRESFFSFLQELTKVFKIQFIMVSHEDEYIDNIPWKARFVQVDSETKVVCSG